MTDVTKEAHLLLIGSAASQAMSPGLWNPVLRELGAKWTYKPWDVPPGCDMASVRARLLENDVVAANVTMPHKHWAAETADSATDDVRLSGACNLLLRKGSGLVGHNTDVTALRVLLGGSFQRHALLMGAGGAARAALIALNGQVGTVTITDRNPAAMEELLGHARELGIDAGLVDWKEAQGLASGASVVVNATPIGKNTSDGPVWGKGPLAPDAIFYDFVYASHVTASIARAQELGARHVDGWDHLREQALAMVPLLELEERASELLKESLALLQADS